MGQLRPKDASVKFDVIDEGGAVILAALARHARLSSWDWLISCGTDSHGPTNPHTRGNAYDVSLANFPSVDAIIECFQALQYTLGHAFTVLFEVPYLQTDPRLARIAYVNPDATGKHYHIQVKRGTIYPAMPGGAQQA